jgi:hypothetical protein
MEDSPLFLSSPLPPAPRHSLISLGCSKDASHGLEVCKLARISFQCGKMPLQKLI